MIHQHGFEERHHWAAKNPKKCFHMNLQKEATIVSTTEKNPTQINAPKKTSHRALDLMGSSFFKSCFAKKFNGMT